MGIWHTVLGVGQREYIQVEQGFQNKVLRGGNAPWHIRNNDLHRELDVEMVADVVEQVAENHEHGRGWKILKRTKPLCRVRCALGLV